MTISERVIHLAKERALFRFRVIAQQALRAAGDGARQRMKDTRSTDEERALTDAYEFILQHGKAFQHNLEAAYRDLLDRAMATMYTDLRMPLDRFSADDLSLIDDDTINRQIRIDHMVQRLRDADDEHLQRVNLILGRMHGKNDAKERENPFRPYLMARALHQTVHEMVVDKAVSLRLFELVSEGLAGQLPDFYRSIREVFESNGIRAHLVAEKSLYGGTGIGGLQEQVALDLGTRVLPGLKRVLDTADAAAQPLEIQRFVDGIFHAPASPATPLQAGSRALMARLDGFQQQAARGESLSLALAPEQNQLFALNAQIGPEETTRLERVAIDVVAMLFELILADAKIAGRFRMQIGRLQIPFLKAAMLAPDMLQQAAHPARQLVNRMGSAAVGLDPASPSGEKLEREIVRIVDTILADFKDDIGIFALSLDGFERFLAQQFYRSDADAELGVAALEAVEDGDRQPAMPAWLDDFSIDPRVVDFIATTWVRVLERERALEPAPAGTGPAGGFHGVLPDLVWSVQPKQNAQERTELVRMLPGLVKRLEAGLALLELNQDEMRRELDQLVAVHTQVLRGALAATSRQSAALPELRERFERQKAADEGAADAPIETGRYQRELAKRGVAIDLDLERGSSPSFDSDADWLDSITLGTSVERWSDDGFSMGRLAWISKRRTLYLVKLQDQSIPVVYSKTSLVKSLREGSLRLIEHAPVFERAVESLLLGVRSADGRG
jgi:hypothetical protein